jgi:hypothetical protein
VNKAFRLSRGEIIGWLNSDDAYFDCRVVEDVVAYFASHPDVDVAYGHCLQITDDGRAIQVLWAPPFDDHLLKIVDPWMQPSTFVRRRALSDPMLDASFHFAMDYELWLRLAAEGRRFGRIGRILSVDRHQPARKSATMKDVHRADLERLRGEYGLELGADRERRRSAFYVRQRLMGALLIPAVRGGSVAFSAPPDLKAGLWRRQVGSRRSSWPEALR